jgi:hypothetical protein
VGVLRLAIGKRSGARAGDILGFVAGAGGHSRDHIGAIRLFPLHALVELNRGDPGALAERLARMRFKGKRARVEIVN